MDKAQVARTLREISLLLQLRGENAFKSRAYDVAADRIAGLGDELPTLVRERRLEELPGIGKAIAEKITELVTTGRLAYLDELRNGYPPGVLELVKVPDVGPKKAALLWNLLQIATVADLERACREGRIRHVKGFGEKSEQKILSGIELYKRSAERHLLGDALPIARELVEFVRTLPGVQRASLGGSVRRSCETVADVDLIASAPDAAAVFDAFVKHNQVMTILGRGESKCSVRLARKDLQVDLRVLPDADYATALHHFTGSKAHHIRLRSLALEKGLTISEWGVHRGSEKLSIPTEEALYQALDLQFVPPELREDRGEIEYAKERRLPTDLVQDSDIKGAVHSHSTWSDGKATLEVMARAARDRGLGYLTVTEHSQAAHYAGGLDAKRLQEQWDEIDRLNASLGGFRLIKGLEVDILQDGALDLPEELLARLEVVIGSIHQRHQMNEEQMTARVLKAIDHPRLQILGHLTGRLINERDPYPLKLDEVFERAAKAGVVIEVNGNPHRLDINADQVRQALQRGVRLVASVDSHSVADLDNVTFAVATARKGWAKKSDILNTLSADDFLSALRRPHSR